MHGVLCSTLVHPLTGKKYQCEEHLRKDLTAVALRFPHKAHQRHQEAVVDGNREWKEDAHHQQRGGDCSQLQSSCKVRQLGLLCTWVNCRHVGDATRAVANALAGLGDEARHQNEGRRCRLHRVAHKLLDAIDTVVGRAEAGAPEDAQQLQEDDDDEKGSPPWCGLPIRSHHKNPDDDSHE